MNVIGKELLLFVVEHCGEIIDPTLRCRRNRILIHAPRQHCHSGKEKIVRLRQLGLSGRVIAARDQRRLKHENAVEFRAATIVFCRYDAAPQRIVPQYSRELVRIHACQQRVHPPCGLGKLETRGYEIVKSFASGRHTPICFQHVVRAGVEQDFVERINFAKSF
jgi:hypothetical protein